MVYVKPQTALKGDNSGSCVKLQEYLDKENYTKVSLENGKFKMVRKPIEELDFFFNDKKDMISLAESIEMIDNNRKGLSAKQSKFYSITYNFSKYELKGRTDEDLKNFVKDTFTKDYVASITGDNHNLNPDSIVWHAKLEHVRTFKNWDDTKDLIPEGYKVGDVKPGDNRHVHITVCRMTTEGKKVSPLGRNKGSLKESARVGSGFDRVDFKQRIERSFDRYFDFTRHYMQSFQYYNLKNKQPQDREKFYDNLYTVQKIEGEKEQSQGLPIPKSVSPQGQGMDEDEIRKRKKKKRNNQKGR